jgi:riboflavin synthase
MSAGIILIQNELVLQINKEKKVFTGIVEEIGSVKHIVKGASSCVLNISAQKVMQGTRLGDSIAVNGVCLTVTDIFAGGFSADVMPETLRRSGLGQLTSGSPVNLERAMAADGRFGGHIVSGHIDGTGTVAAVKREDNAVWITINCPDRILKYIIEKGSIAIDGISLTVAYVDSKCFKVSIIPHTAKETTLLTLGVGHLVNLENDVVGKYVEKLLSYKKDTSPEENNSQSKVDLNFLAENGFL